MGPLRLVRSCPAWGVSGALLAHPADGVRVLAMCQEELISMKQILEEMSWVEIGEAIARNVPVILPLGAIEQHGPHLPVDSDAYFAGEISTRAAKGFDMLVAPTVCFGYRSRPLSGGGQHFPGTLSLSGKTYISLVQEVLSELIRHGFRRLLVYVWHMENQNFAYEAAYLAVGDRTDVKVVVMEFPFDSLSDKTMAVLFPDGFPGWAEEHASILETSLMLHLRPEAVDMSRAVDDCSEAHPTYDIIPPPASITTKSGVLHKATQGTAEKGVAALGEIVEHLRDVLRTEFPDIAGAKP